MHRFNRNVSKEDVTLFDKCCPRPKLADVINAAYYLEMPDLIDTLVKYTANNLEGKTAEQMSWLEIPLKKDEKKKEAEDEGEGGSAEKRERADDA
ncbi:hypothetical protein L596_023429 [Steinernema carpocapsae]|uniref:SKP1 component dimerisation domain-containing protein n=1 Tax=Steinernema carpocapsae TaxID=34508 RepID=A0A4U5MDM1_STECR|nr:hypothetical protein L596_023429 [Steinernema carpocapsae]